MRFPLLHSLTARLIASHLLVGIISVGFIASIAAHFIMDSGRHEAEKIYEEIAFLLSNRLELPFLDMNQGVALDPLVFQNILDQGLSGNDSVRYTIFFADGTPFVTNESVDFSVIPPEVQMALQKTEGTQIRPDERGREAFYVAVPVMHETKLYGVLRLSSTFDENLKATYRSITLLWSISALLLLVVVISSWWFSYSLSQPIKNLTDVARRLSSGELSARASLRGPDELRQFASTFNEMAIQLQTHIDALHAFAANASHELRSPMTAIKLHVDALADGAIADPQVAGRFLAQLQGEVDRMSRLVNDLLDLSRIEANRDQVLMDEVNLAQVLLEARDFWRPRSQNAGVELRLNLPEPITAVIGNEDQLSQVFYNLIDNAIKHTPAGGWVEISLAKLTQRGVVRVEVRDNGVGISAQNLEHVFERFYRADVAYTQKVTGSGLGLAIAKTIIEAHHGRIGVNSMEGMGSTFWVELAYLSPSLHEQKTIPVPARTFHIPE